MTSEESVQPDKSAEQAANARYTLLVVDDNENNRELLTRRLQKQGFQFQEAANGREALELLSEHKFDLVLLDLHMPEVSGYEVLEKMKADSIWRHIPVIVITAVDDMDSVARCIRSGAEDYLPKPFNSTLLQARIGACLEKKRLRELEQTHLRQIKAERRAADDLLHMLFPHMIIDELKSTKTVRPRRHENVAVLFCDIVGFTAYCDQRLPEDVIPHLRELFEEYEDLVVTHGLEKIKTIGDAFMATAGLLTHVENPVLNCVKCGLEMIRIAGEISARWEVRVGIHCGPIVSGLVGQRQYSFDLWGDTVNTAARVESHGRPGCVNVSAAAWQQIADRCRGESLGVVPVKGKVDLEIFRFKEFLPE